MDLNKTITVLCGAIASFSCGDCGLLLMGNFSVKPRKQHQTPSAGVAALPASSVCPAPHQRNSSHLTRRVKPEGAGSGPCQCSHPLAAQWHVEGAVLPWAHAEPWALWRASAQFLFCGFWFGWEWWGKGKVLPLFFPQLGTSCASFSSAHLKLPIRIHYDSKLCKY